MKRKHGIVIQQNRNFDNAAVLIIKVFNFKEDKTARKGMWTKLNGDIQC